jgi:preprotein translocase subunit YajC
MNYTPWIVIGGVVIIGFTGFLILRSDEKKAQKSTDETNAVTEAQAVTKTESAMAQAQTDAPATDAAIDARLEAGTA